MSIRVHTVVGSPIGPLTLVAEGGVLTGLYMDQQRHRPPEQTFGDPDPAPFGAVVAQLAEYFAGQRAEFDLPLCFVGTPFQRAVWAGLREIRYGETVSYAELAERIGRPTAARAVGLANGKNPISIIVPCHRVVGAGGDLTGYGGGLARKRHLLDFERGAGLFATEPSPMAALHQALSCTASSPAPRPGSVRRRAPARRPG